MKFMALGSTDAIGATCYYLEIANKRFLLDVGIGLCDKLPYTPDFTQLENTNSIYALSQLDGIFISHAHYDHIGALPMVAEWCPNTPIYATALTCALAEYCLNDTLQVGAKYSPEKCCRKAIALQAALTQITRVSLLSSITIGDVKVTFYEAGHMPGAMMIYFESPEGTVLYTGDFNPQSTALTQGYHLPESIVPDTIILAGTHAKHPNYRPYNGMLHLMPTFSEHVAMGDTVYLECAQLTKGIETVRYLATEMEENRLPQYPVFVDDAIWDLCAVLSNLYLSILPMHCQRFNAQIASEPHHPKGFYVGSKRYAKAFQTRYSPQVTLHAAFADCVDLLQRHTPQTLFVVHAPCDREDKSNDALAQAFPQIDTIYPAQGQLYTNKQKKGETKWNR